MKLADLLQQTASTSAEVDFHDNAPPTSTAMRRQVTFAAPPGPLAQAARPALRRSVSALPALQSPPAAKRRCVRESVVPAAPQPGAALTRAQPSAWFPQPRAPHPAPTVAQLMARHAATLTPLYAAARTPFVAADVGVHADALQGDAPACATYRRLLEATQDDGTQQAHCVAAWSQLWRAGLPPAFMDDLLGRCQVAGVVALADVTKQLLAQGHAPAALVAMLVPFFAPAALTFAQHVAALQPMGYAVADLSRLYARPHGDALLAALGAVSGALGSTYAVGDLLWAATYPQAHVRLAQLVRLTPQLQRLGFASEDILDLIRPDVGSEVLEAVAARAPALRQRNIPVTVMCQQLEACGNDVAAWHAWAEGALQGRVL